MTAFYLGCAVWAYRNWLGDFYPVGSRPADFLRLYAERLTAVEGNTTFYATPDLPTLQRWTQDTPATFRFCLKLPRAITHSGDLKQAIAPSRAFVDRMSALGPRLGPIFAQLPPSYGPEHWDDLMTFLDAWPQTQARLALEVRHPAWFAPKPAQQLAQQLQQRQVARVLLDTRPIYNCPDDPQLNSERRKPKLPVQPSLTTDFTLIRFISHPDRPRNHPYLHEWSQRLNRWLQQGTTVYLFVHCPVEDHSPTIAFDFQATLEAMGAAIPALPQPLKGDRDSEQLAAAAQPQQLRLFG